MRFILLNIGLTNMILGHNWLLCHNPKINWLTREIQMTHCPEECKKWQKHIKQCISIKKIHDPLAEVRDKLPNEIKEYADVFIERPVGQLPTRKPWDHYVDLKEGFIPQKGRIIPLPMGDVQKIKEFIEENIKKGFIRPSKSSQTAPIFFIPKKDTTEKRMITDY